MASDHQREIFGSDERCSNCGSHVTDGFRRIFGDSYDVAHHCPECDGWSRIKGGSAAGKTPRVRLTNYKPEGARPVERD